MPQDLFSIWVQNPTPLLRKFHVIFAGNMRVATERQPNITTPYAQRDVRMTECAQTTSFYLGEIIQAVMKRKEFRKKVPMSVFIDLERK